jgi:general secretion pathway protein G
MRKMIAWGKRVLARLQQKPANAEDGWTFIETLIVLGIVLILTASVGFMSVRYIQKAKFVAARSQVETFVTALQAYYLDCGVFPTPEQGLQALFSRPTQDPVPSGWRGPYIAKPAPKDPWENEYVYAMPGPEDLPFAISSYGLDAMVGGEGENEDINSW